MASHFHSEDAHPPHDADGDHMSIVSGASLGDPLAMVQSINSAPAVDVTPLLHPPIPTLLIRCRAIAIMILRLEA
jgi:hypothetical protein